LSKTESNRAESLENCMKSVVSEDFSFDTLLNPPSEGGDRLKLRTTIPHSKITLTTQKEKELSSVSLSKSIERKQKEHHSRNALFVFVESLGLISNFLGEDINRGI
jgi:hypothetical protein